MHLYFNKSKQTNPKTAAIVHAQDNEGWEGVLVMEPCNSSQNHEAKKKSNNNQAVTAILLKGNVYNTRKSFTLYCVCVFNDGRTENTWNQLFRI